MTTAATISARLTLDKSDYDSGLDNAVKSAQSFKSKMQGVGKSMMATGAMMTAGITAPIIGLGAFMVNAASNLNESQNAMNVVFGEGSKAVEEFAQNSATAVGMSKSEWYQLAAVQGAALKNYGYSAEEAGLETIKLGQRAADMASIFNTSVPDAMNAIGSLMRGEIEPAKRYGISMNQASIEAKAMSMGLIESTVDMVKLNGIRLDSTNAQNAMNKAIKAYGPDSMQAQEATQKFAEVQQALEKAMEGSNAQMTPAQKAQASLALFYEQTDQFAGDFANTSDQLANGSRILTAQLKDEAAAIGTQLLPYVLKGVQFLGKLLEKVRAMTPEQKKWVLITLAVAAAIGPLITILGGLVTVLSAVTWPILLIIGVMAILYLAWTNNWGGIQEKTAAVWAWLQPILQSIWNWLAVNVPIAIQILADFWTNVLSPAIEDAIEFIMGIVEEGLQFITDISSGQMGEWSAIWDRTMATIKVIVTTILTNVRLFFLGWKQLLSGDFTAAGATFRTIWDNAWKALATLVRTGWDNIRSLTRVAVDNLKSWFASIDWASVGRNLVANIANGLIGALPLLLSAGRNLFSALGDFLGGFFSGGTVNNGGGGGGGGCFVGGTMVMMADGFLQKIETVRVGDVVISFDTRTETIVKAKVVETFEHPEGYTYLLINDHLGVTPDHLMYSNGDWKPAGGISIGEYLLDSDKQLVRVDSIRQIEERVTVYNLHTDDETHNYFAGGVLVHNAKRAKGSPGWESVPGGYPDDSYPVWMTSGEKFAVIPRGGNLPSNGPVSGSSTVNYFHPNITILSGRQDPKKSMKGFV